MRIDSAGGTDNFNIKIANGANPGAANLKSTVLNDTTSWTGHSSIANGSQIAGNLTGNLEVVASGGAVSLTIQGNAVGDITAPVVSSLTIDGDLSGDISVTDELTTGLTVGGDVASSATIEIADLSGTLHFNTVGLANAEFAGDLIIHDDLDFMEV